MKAYKFVLTLLLMCAAHQVAAQSDDPVAVTKADGDTAVAVPSGGDAQTADDELAEIHVDPKQRLGIFGYSSKYINSLLKEKNVPIFGGEWSGEVMIDAPLNSEPEDARAVMRRAKLRYERGFGDSWLVKLTANYTRSGGLELADNFIVYSGWKTALLTFGVFDPPFSLESMSSSGSLTFMERSLVVDALSERQSGGLSFLKRTPNHIFNGMLVFLNPKDNDLRQSGQAFIGHYVYSPIDLQGSNSVHIGGSFSYRQNTNGNSTQFRTLPEIATAENYFVDTGTIAGAEKVVRLGFEASNVSGRFSWQTEVLATRVTRNSADRLNFWGAYAYVSWFLTNDTRNYDLGTGSFGVMTPSSPIMHGGWGAFEVAARVSYVNLTSKDVIGGKEKNISLGFNWYLNEKLGVMTNLIKVLDVNRPGSEFDNQDPLIFSIRAQWLMR